MSLTTIKRKRGRPRRDEPREINDFDLMLIQEFQRHRCFYDRSHPQYRNREYYERQWVEIARKLGHNVQAIKDRMIQLRSRFNQEKRRLETIQDQYNDSDVTSQWPLYDNLLFLNDHIQHRGSYLRSLPQSGGLSTGYKYKRANDIDGEDADVEGDGERDVNGTPGYDDTRHFVNGSSITKPSISITNDENALSEPNTISYANQQQHCNPIRADNNIELANNGVDKFNAFGQFLVSALVEMNEKDALRLVEKFTSELVKNLITEYNVKESRQNNSFINI